MKIHLSNDVSIPGQCGRRWYNIETTLGDISVFSNSTYLTIKITAVIPANAKRRSDVVLMLGQRRIQWYNIKPTERQVSVLTGEPLNLFPFDKQI